MSRRQKVIFVERILEQKHTHKLLEREKREKRREKRRERKKSEQCIEKEEQKKMKKTRSSLPSAAFFLKAKKSKCAFLSLSEKCSFF